MGTTEKECIESLQKATAQLGKSPTKTEYEELGLRPASGTIIRVVGGWNEAKQRAGLKTHPSTGSRVREKPKETEIPPELDWESLSVDQRWHYQNVQWNTKRTLRRRARLRSWVSEQKESEGCQVCGETNCSVLDFHHLDPSEKTMAITEMVTYGYGRERLSNEMAKCVVLCANCHRKEHGNRQDTNKSLRGRSHRYKHRQGCSKCDEHDPCALVFHHTTGQKRMTVAQMISDGYPKNEILEEIEKCVLLCSNCHRKEHVGGPEPNE